MEGTTENCWKMLKERGCGTKLREPFMGSVWLSIGEVFRGSGDRGAGLVKGMRRRPIDVHWRILLKNCRIFSAIFLEKQKLKYLSDKG
jgi:hypothetical protein